MCKTGANARGSSKTFNSFREIFAEITVWDDFREISSNYAEFRLFSEN
jgi:hypothetical protein